MPEEKEKNKKTFYSLGGRERQSPRPITREKKEDKFNTAYVYYERTNETVYQEFLLVPTFCFLSRKRFQQSLVLASVFYFCWSLMSVKRRQREKERETVKAFYNQNIPHEEVIGG